MPNKKKRLPCLWFPPYEPSPYTDLPQMYYCCLASRPSRDRDAWLLRDILPGIGFKICSLWENPETGERRVIDWFGYPDEVKYLVGWQRVPRNGAVAVPQSEADIEKLQVGRWASLQQELADPGRHNRWYIQATTCGVIVNGFRQVWVSYNRHTGQIVGEKESKRGQKKPRGKRLKRVLARARSTRK